jgi:hypothetical protein
MGWLKRSIDGFLENNQHEHAQKVERRLPSELGRSLGSQEGTFTSLS